MKYVIIGKKNCKWCDKALDLLKERGQFVHYMDTNTYPDLVSLLDYFSLDTLPQVFEVRKGGVKWIGGFTELALELA